MYYKRDDQQDEFGPGTDLVLSLMALAIMLLGVTGVSVKNAPQDPARSEEICPPTEAPEDCSSHEIRVANLQKEIDDLQSVECEVVDVDPVCEQPTNTLFTDAESVMTLQDRKDYSYFEIDSAVLSNSARKTIVAKLSQLRAAIRDQGGNHLVFRGYASPEPKADAAARTHDQNMDLSVERALSVSHYLGELGLPYACMSVTGIGRGRSEFLQKFAEFVPEETVAVWDELFIREPGKISQFVQDIGIKKSLESERKVEVLVVNDPNSICTNQRLLAALSR